jgi:hypothetical protein
MIYCGKEIGNEDIRYKVFGTGGAACGEDSGKVG